MNDNLNEPYFQHNFFQIKVIPKLSEINTSEAVIDSSLKM